MVIGRNLAQAYIDDPRHADTTLYRNNTRAIMDDHFQRAHDEAVSLVRECFLNMIADADRWEEDVDGDCDGEGRPTITVDYSLRVGHSQLTELCEALGIKPRFYDETLKDAIDAAVAEPPPALSLPASTPENQ